MVAHNEGGLLHLVDLVHVGIVLAAGACESVVGFEVVAVEEGLARRIPVLVTHGGGIGVLLGGPVELARNGDMLLAHVVQELEILALSLVASGLRRRRWHSRLDAGESSLHTVEVSKESLVYRRQAAACGGRHGGRWWMALEAATMSTIYSIVNTLCFTDNFT